MIAAVHRWRHLLLLGVLLLTLITQPLVGHASQALKLAFDLLVVGVAVVAFLVVFRAPWERRVAAAFAVPIAALALAEHVLPAGWFVRVAVAYHVFSALFLGFAVAVLVRDIFQRSAISSDEVVGAFAGYLLLGIMWGNLFAILEVLAPGAFSVNPDIRWQLEDWHLRRALFNYFSFATMASLGYNDITPIAPIANTLSWIEVMSAQFYHAVVIAQIIGLKLARAVRSGGAG